MLRVIGDQSGETERRAALVLGGRHRAVDVIAPPRRGRCAQHVLIDDVVIPDDAFDPRPAGATGDNDVDIERPVREQQTAVDFKLVRALHHDIVPERR